MTSVDEDTLREVAAACPTQAIVLEDVIEPVPG
jgi:ferredoxin